MTKKMFVIDLDGTLLNNYAQLSNTTIKYINSIKDQHHIIINTGRPYATASTFHQQLGLSTPLVTDNGGHIWFSETEYVDFGVDKDVISMLGKAFKESIKSAFFIHGKDIYVYNFDPRLLRAFYINVSERDVHHIDLANCPVSGAAIIILLLKESQVAFEEFLNDVGGPLLGYRNWGSDARHVIYEIYNKGISKFSALKYLQNHLNVLDEDIHAFGDSINDLEMILGVANGYAMPNCSPSLKSLAKQFVKHTNHNDGVVRQIDKILKK